MSLHSMIPSSALRLVAAAMATLGALVFTPAAGADAGWPRQFDSSSGTFVVYQPQPEDLAGDMLTGRAAFSLQKSSDAQPTFGVLWFSERIEIDRDSSTVTARSLDLTKVRLPRITAVEEDRYEKLLEAEAARWDLSGSLAELQSGLAAAERERASVAGLDTVPPRIVFAYERALLVTYDGAPLLEPLEGTSLQSVVNTPYAVVYDPTSRQYYLSGANLWYAARDPLGPWDNVSEPPASVRAVVPPDTSSSDRTEGIPLVLTATEPTELISTDGPPRYAPLVGDELLYVTNTENDVLREVSSQSLFVLLSGRWYRSPSPDGPWTFVRGDRLPASFRRILPDSPKGHVLASVAGTEQADDALADTEIPQTSAIRRDDSGFSVEYDGAPQFEPIEGTDLQYAVNTDAEVIFADGRYYACDQGVWYIADSPEGPWVVSETRPLGVDDIPPDCPVYNVRYVYIYDATPEVVYVGYLPGYFGCYPYYGTVVYGTGYHYRPWRGHRHYYPRPRTWGFYARYNPWLSRWSFGFSYSTGFFRVGTRWRSSSGAPQAHAAAMWFGPGGYRRPLLAQDGTPVRVRPMLRRWATRGDRPPMNLYNRPGNVGRVDRAAVRLPMGVVARPAVKVTTFPNNVLAGRDGKVYQRETKGKWKVNDGRVWRPTQVPVASPGSRTAGGGREVRGSSPELPGRVERPRPQPTPTERTVQRPEQPRVTFPIRPTPPAVAPTPGNLEREYQARERSSGSERPDAAAPTARPTPARIEPKAQDRPRDTSPPERRR